MWINNAQFVRTVLVLLAAPRRRPMCCRHCGLFLCVMWLFFCSPPTRWYRTPVCVPEPFCFTNEALLKGMICRTAPKNARSMWRRLCSPPVFPRVRSILTCWGRFWASTFFGEWCPDPAHIDASVIQSAMKAAGLCVCRKRHCGGVGVFVSARLFTHSLACWNSFVMKLIAPQWTRGFPGSWEFNESDGWSADRISLSVDGGISPEITEIYWLISSMRSNFTASTLSFFPAPWCAELSQPAKQAFEWRGKRLSHLLFYFEPPSVSVQSAVSLVSLLRIRWSQNSQRRLRVAVLSRARPILTAPMNSHAFF